MLLSSLLFRTIISIYKMIEDIIRLTKEPEYKSREITTEKRKADMLLCDVSIGETFFAMIITIVCNVHWIESIILSSHQHNVSLL